MANTYEVIPMTTGDKSGKKIDNKGLVTLTAQLMFSVTLDEGTSDDSTTVEQNAVDLPQRNDSHPNRPNLRVVDVKVAKKAVIYYEATVLYESVKFNGPDEEDLPPIELAAEIEYSAITTDEEIDEDADGEPIATKADEPIEGLTKSISDQAVTIKKNFLEYNPATFYLFMNKTNEDEFLGFPVGSARVTDIKATNAIKDDVPYWIVTVTVVFRTPYRTTADKAWYKRVLNRGFYEKKPGVDIPVRAQDGEGKDFTQQVLLDETGERLDPGADPVWLEFPIYESTTFASMGLF